MSVFISDHNNIIIAPNEFDKYKQIFRTPCGTAACAIGHGPLAGIKPTKDDYNWVSYSERVFIEKSATERSNVAWTWCFGSSWAYIDNSPRGAAKRIQYLLKNHEVPDWFTIDMVYRIIEESEDIHDNPLYKKYFEEIY